MDVDIRGRRKVISPNGIDYTDRLIGVCYDHKKGAKFQGDLKELGFVEVLGLDNEQRIYRVDATEKLDFEGWVKEWSNNIVKGEFPNYRLKLKEVILNERG